MNATKITERYIETHPSIKDCVKKDLVNFSQLSREIIKNTELKSKDFDAVLIACRRYQRKLRSFSPQEDKIVKILQESSIEVKNKIAVIVIDNTSYVEDILALERQARKQRSIYYAIEGTQVITLVVSVKLVPFIKNLFKRTILQVSDGMALVIIQSPEEIEHMTGSLGYLSSLLGHNNINIVENMSCWNETLFVVEEKDIAGVMKALNFS